MDVQDMGLPELSKTHSSLTGAGRERKGNATACIPLGQSASWAPQASGQKWGSVCCLPTYASGLMWCKEHQDPPQNVGVKILAVKVLGRSVKQNGRDHTYTPGMSGHKTCVKAAPLPLPPLVTPSFLPLLTSSLLRMSAQPAGRGEHKQSL